MAVNVDIQKQLGDFRLDIRFKSSARRIGILGASGSGKSMTLKSIAGIEQPDRGIIEADGRTFYDRDRRISLKPQERNVGYLFQNYALFPTMTVEKNIAAGLKGGRKEKEARVREMIRKFRLEGLEKHLPGQLSGGQQQRTALARIMTCEPGMILLDEPFSALDMYMKEASRFAEKAALENIDFKGPLTAPILSTLTARITEGVAAVLLEDAGKLDNFIPALLEGKLSFESEGMEFFGIIDRMSVSRATGDAVIIDYKSGSNYPRYGDYEVQNGKMNDFQIPLYILLAENSRESPVAERRVQQAWIFSIRQQKYIPVLNDKDDQEFSGIFNSRTKSWESVEEFKPSMDALKKAAEDFRQAVTNYNFTSGDFDWKRCAACEYNGICRQTYSVKPAANG